MAGLGEDNDINVKEAINLHRTNVAETIYIMNAKYFILMTV